MAPEDSPEPVAEVQEPVAEVQEPVVEPPIKAKVDPTLNGKGKKRVSSGDRPLLPFLVRVPLGPRLAVTIVDLIADTARELERATHRLSMRDTKQRPLLKLENGEEIPIFVNKVEFLRKAKAAGL